MAGARVTTQKTRWLNRDSYHPPPTPSYLLEAQEKLKETVMFQPDSQVKSSDSSRTAASLLEFTTTATPFVNFLTYHRLSCHIKA